jgi:hypothetical protein
MNGKAPKRYRSPRHGSYFGFSAKIENYNYKLLGIRPMLACVHARHTPPKPCQFDNQRTVCPES